MSPIIGMVLMVLVVLTVAVAMGYSTLVQKRHRCREAWGLVAAALRRRWDLTPSLVETIESRAPELADRSTRAMDARSVAMEAAGVRSQTQAERILTTTLKQTVDAAAADARLRADSDFVRKRDELTSEENRITVAEQQYNEVVRAYNDSLIRPYLRPIASIFRFARQPASEMFAVTGDCQEKPS